MLSSHKVLRLPYVFAAVLAAQATNPGPEACSASVTSAPTSRSRSTPRPIRPLAPLTAPWFGNTPSLNYPEFAFLRGDPRVKALRKKVGLPE
jgi:hypothetical protein